MAADKSEGNTSDEADTPSSSPSNMATSPPSQDSFNLPLLPKEVAEDREKKRKRHYTLELELAWMGDKISHKGKPKLVTKALQKMKGKIPEIAMSHASSGVLQTCVKHCSQAERDAVFEELRPHFVTLSYNAYAVHLVKWMLDHAPKKQFAGFISTLCGHIAPLTCHMVGSVVVEHAYELATDDQKEKLLLELCCPELESFDDLVSREEGRSVDVASVLRLQRDSDLRHMTSMIQPILEKGIIDHSIIHRLFMEYFSMADPSSVRDIMGQLSSPHLVRMISSRDGAALGNLCVKHVSAKERKKIIKGMRGHIDKIAFHKYGCMVLVCIISVVDDTKLITEAIISELQKILKELIVDKTGRCVILQLLHPNCSRYFSRDQLFPLNVYMAPLPKDHSEASTQNETSMVERPWGRVREEEMEVKADGINKDKTSEVEEHSDKEAEEDKEDEANKDKTSADSHPVESGKKDPMVRRQELLIKSRLAESLIDICIENAGELIQSDFGKDVIYEVAIGGSDGILHPYLDDKINSLHETIASLVATLKSEEEEHVLENFHSSRIIRQLVLDCPSFASTMWEKALKGKGEIWASGHSRKVVSAFMESSDPKVHELVRNELQPLIDKGILRKPKALN